MFLWTHCVYIIAGLFIALTVVLTLVHVFLSHDFWNKYTIWVFSVIDGILVILATYVLFLVPKDSVEHMACEACMEREYHADGTKSKLVDKDFANPIEEMKKRKDLNDVEKTINILNRIYITIAHLLTEPNENRKKQALDLVKGWLDYMYTEEPFENLTMAINNEKDTDEKMFEDYSMLEKWTRNKVSLLQSYVKKLQTAMVTSISVPALTIPKASPTRSPPPRPARPAPVASPAFTPATVASPAPASATVITLPTKSSKRVVPPPISPPIVVTKSTSIGKRTKSLPSPAGKPSPLTSPRKPSAFLSAFRTASLPKPAVSPPSPNVSPMPSPSSPVASPSFLSESEIQRRLEALRKPDVDVPKQEEETSIGELQRRFKALSENISPKGDEGEEEEEEGKYDPNAQEQEEMGQEELVETGPFKQKKEGEQGEGDQGEEQQFAGKYSALPDVLPPAV